MQSAWDLELSYQTSSCIVQYLDHSTYTHTLPLDIDRRRIQEQIKALAAFLSDFALSVPSA